MTFDKKIFISEYDYPLPDERIAQFPLEQRDRSKLVLLKNGKISEDIFSNIASYLPQDSLVLFNETRVIHARLHFIKETGARIEVFCLEPLAPTEIQQVFASKECCEWKCLVGNAKRWKDDESLTLEFVNGSSTAFLKASIISRYSDWFHIRFEWKPEELSFSEVLEHAGKVPLPPYIHREATDSDDIRYQSIFARNEGSVAAPTASLHFTDEVMENLRQKNIQSQKVTLHVGAGTFKPVSTDLVNEHQMHSEKIIIPREVIRHLYENTEQFKTLVGTTTVRSIESIYWQGVKWIESKAASPELDIRQWDPYESSSADKISVKNSLEMILETLDKFGVDALRGSTSLMIAPGYRVRFSNAIITNFHQPKSTLLLLVAAFIGEKWKDVYRFALDNDFRFLSYGDSCLFIP